MIFHRHGGIAMVNLYTKFEVSRSTRYEWQYNTQKIGWFGGTQGHGQCHHSIERIRLPMQLQQKDTAIWYGFPDTASYLPKIANFNPPHLHLVPQLRVTPVEFH